jgi:hypothetical protein
MLMLDPTWSSTAWGKHNDTSRKEASSEEASSEEESSGKEAGRKESSAEEEEIDQTRLRFWNRSFQSCSRTKRFV